MTADSVATAPRSPIDKLLNAVAEVRPGEGLTAVLLGVTVFLLLAGYYIIKPVREALILAGGGAEIKSYSGAVQAALFVLIVPAFGAFASRVNRVRLMTGLFLFFASNLLVFYLLSRQQIPLGVPFFLWIGIFNVMAVALFWSFANDLYSDEQGKRLFAIIGVGSLLGSVTGSKAAELMVEPLGVYQMMLVSAVILVVCVVLVNVIQRREGDRAFDAGKLESAAKPLDRRGGFELVIKHRYLLLIGLLILMINWVNTTGEYILGKTVSQAAAASVAAGTTGDLGEKEIIGSFYANFQFWQNLIGAFLQLFLVSRIIKFLGVRGALFILPTIAFFGYSLMAALPALAFIRAAKILENSTDYSLNNTVRHALFLLTPREAKYKAKQATDSFFWRTGDMLSALTVFVAAGIMHLTVDRFAIFNLVLVVVWVLIAIGIVREHRKLTDAPQTSFR